MNGYPQALLDVKLGTWERDNLKLKISHRLRIHHQLSDIKKPDLENQDQAFGF
jgi:hypothetical protein